VGVVKFAASLLSFKQYPCHHWMAVRPGAEKAIFTRKGKHFLASYPLFALSSRLWKSDATLLDM